MKKEFISHLGSKEKTLMFHGSRDDTVILKEKQPHEDSERLFEYLSEKDKIKIEASLDGRAAESFSIRRGDYSCAVNSMGGHRVAVVANECAPAVADLDDIYLSVESLCAGGGLVALREAVVSADELLAKISYDLCSSHPDMEFEFYHSGGRGKMLESNVSNIIRICSLCANFADEISTDRLLVIRLRDTTDTLSVEFITGAGRGGVADIDAHSFVGLADFVAERENGKLTVAIDGGKLKMNFMFASDLEEFPEFKFQEQFEEYEKYFDKIRCEILRLRAQE